MRRLLAFLLRRRRSPVSPPRAPHDPDRLLRIYRERTEEMQRFRRAA